MPKSAPFDMFGISPTFFIRGEEKQITFMGCVCTVLMISLLGAVSVFYAIQFFNKVNVQSTSTTIASKTYPVYDLNQNKFFLTFSYRIRGRAELPEYIEEYYMRVRASLVKYEFVNDFGVTYPEVVREELAIEPCGSLKTTVDDINFDAGELGERARCLEFEKETKIGGTEGEAKFSYIEIRFEACDKSDPDCAPQAITAGDTIATPNSSKLDEAFEIFQDLTIDLGFLDASGNIEDFNSPITLNSNSNNQIRLNLYQEKLYDFYFGQLIVNTNSGFFWKKTTKDTALKLTSSFFESVHREPEFEEQFETDAFDEVVPRPYSTVRILVSNKVTTINRDYETIVDTFANIGGVAQTITFFFIFVMVFHHEIRMEQALLNEAILQNDTDNEENKDKTNPQNTIKSNQINLAKTPNKIQPLFKKKTNEGDILMTQEQKDKIKESKTLTSYTYSEIVCFKYFCCGRKSRKYKAYEGHLETIKERMDIRNMITNSGNVNVLSNVLLEPYQMKLISHFKKKDDDETKLAKKITLGEAIQTLKSNLDDPKIDEIQKRVDEFLLLHLDDEFKEKVHIDESEVNLIDRSKMKPSNISQVPNSTETMVKKPERTFSKVLVEDL